MTPRGSVSWSAHETHGGYLYVPDTVSDDPMTVLEAYSDNPDNYAELGNGLHGIVRDMGKYAIKSFFERDTFFDGPQVPAIGTLPDLRATVALTEGLKHTPQLKGTNYDIRGVEVLAAFMPGHESTLGSKILWLMEKIEPLPLVPEYLWGNAQHISPHVMLPDMGRRRRLYKQALESYGVRLRDVRLDDGPANLLIERLPSHDSRGSLVKIDTIAGPDNLNF